MAGMPAETVLTGASLSPACEIAAAAAGYDWPVKSGMTIPPLASRGGTATSRLTIELSTPAASGAGFCAITLSAGRRRTASLPLSLFQANAPGSGSMPAAGLIPSGLGWQPAADNALRKLNPPFASDYSYGEGTD